MNVSNSIRRFNDMKLAAILTLLPLLGVSVIHGPEGPRTFHRENVLGTSLELKLVGGSEADAEGAESAVLNEIGRLNSILSTWTPSSEVSRWVRTSGQPVPVSPELGEVLDLYDRYRDLTNGAVNAAAETATRLWGEGTIPTAAGLGAAVSAMGRQHWSLDPAHGTATHLSNAPLALNSFTKSYIVSRAADAALASPNITGVVVNIGGDLVVRGDWTESVHIANPRADSENSDPVDILKIRNQAVATSGDYRRGVDIAGRHYSHIIDPRTAQPAEDIISSTVIADNAADSGALATAFSILNPLESEHIALAKGVEYLLIASNGSRIQSRNWPGAGLALRPVPAPPAPAADAGLFDPSYELIVNLELARLEGNAHRPYVAVWIEDKDKFPVRTIALWYQKPRWLPDMRAWYRDDRMRAMAEGNDITASVSSATRSPGKYTLKWDGKDNAGKLVKAGKYTVCIEVAREHGTYQLIHQEVDFTGTPKQVPLAGNVEISSASLDYRKATH
jgi:thiamine biosynthesis lipoprotein